MSRTDLTMIQRVYLHAFMCLYILIFICPCARARGGLCFSVFCCAVTLSLVVWFCMRSVCACVCFV